MKYFNYNGTMVRLQAEQYSNGGTLAVAMYTKDNELYDVITTNLMDRMQSDSMAFLDENNHTGIGKWLEKHHLALPMHVTRQSGFCFFPLYTIFTSKF
jgi:hypothetical protein